MSFDDLPKDMLQHVAMIGAPEEPPRNDYQDRLQFSASILMFGIAIKCYIYIYIYISYI